MAWVDLPSRHPSGFVWIYDKAFDRERGLRWRAHHLDGFEQGLPGD